MKTALIIILALIVIGGGIYAYRDSSPRNDSEEVFCTLDAKLCPDGSYVGRVPPNCEFALCPGTSTSTATTSASSQTMTGSIINATNTISATGTVALPKNLTVTYTSSGFSPHTAILAKGGTITFVNKSNDDMWVASDPHPLHNGYPAFDERGEVMRDGIWTFKFDQAGSWGYHNHNVPTHKATIIVQ